MNPEAQLKHPVFNLIRQVSKQTGMQAFVIGGFVRDLILLRPCKDIDIVVLGNGIEFAEHVVNLLPYPAKLSVFKNFGTAHFKYDDYDIEFVGARKESYTSDSRKPTVSEGTLEDDQLRRDFTINALAISLCDDNYGVLVDPFNGIKDMEERIIRTPQNPDVTYSDDPLRMMRAVRFACQLNYEIETESLEALKRNAHRLEIISRERIADELNKIILSPSPSIGFKLLEESGLLQQFFPEMIALKGVEKIDGKSHKDNFYHTLEVLDNLSRNTNDLWLRWSAILHDIAKPATKRFEPGIGWTFHGHEDKGARMVPKIFAALRLPLNEKMKYVQKLVLLHLRPIVLAKTEVSDSAVRRLLFEAGDDINDLMLLCEADITTKNPAKLCCR